MEENEKLQILHGKIQYNKSEIFYTQECAFAKRPIPNFQLVSDVLVLQST